MIIKQIEIDQIIISSLGYVSYREITTILENDIELARSYHRTSLVPGQDLSTVPEKVQAICNVVWTPEIVETYKQSLNKE